LCWRIVLVPFLHYWTVMNRIAITCFFLSINTWSTSIWCELDAFMTKFATTAIEPYTWFGHFTFILHFVICKFRRIVFIF
jgi:hypothetical protein